jgi:glycosyltransferase involved in cell wall biosynthesis
MSGTMRGTMTGTMNGSLPAASVIIAVYKRDDFLAMVLESLARQTRRNFEILVADDGSGPEIPAVIERYQSRFEHPVQHVWHPDDGFRKTLIANRTVARARAEYLIFIDGDSICHHRFIESHFAFAAPRRVLCGRRVMLTEEKASRTSVGDVASGRVERAFQYVGNCLRPTIRYAFRLPWFDALRLRWRKKSAALQGANFSLHAADYRAVNGYDESIVGRGLEDDNLGSRLRMAGCKLVLVSQTALQYHLFHRSKPIPHSRETIEFYHHPASAWAEAGLVPGARGATDQAMARTPDTRPPAR